MRESGNEQTQMGRLSRLAWPILYVWGRDLNSHLSLFLVRESLLKGVCQFCEIVEQKRERSWQWQPKDTKQVFATEWYINFMLGHLSGGYLLHNWVMNMKLS